MEYYLARVPSMKIFKAIHGKHGLILYCSRRPLVVMVVIAGKSDWLVLLFYRQRGNFLKVIKYDNAAKTAIRFYKLGDELALDLITPLNYKQNVNF